ncbi:MAG: hypothetical protein IJU37_03915 [Desulfovibrio sp.]|nr:hypothetical protein [Desulfovibrio sp.]
MSIVKHTDKKSGRIYVFESTPHYDPVSKQQRPTKKYLGMLDPETGELIRSSGKRGRKSGSKNRPKPTVSDTVKLREEELKSISARLREVEWTLRTNQKETEKLRRDLDVCKKALSAISEIAQQTCHEVSYL